MALRLGNVFWLQPLNVALTLIELLDLGFVDVKADDADADFSKAQGQRKPNVAQAVDADDGAAILQTLL